jgi:signal transduction histidine kinase
VAGPAPLLQRLLPETLYGRMLLVILGGIVVAHATSIAFFLAERSRGFLQFEASEVAARVVDAVRSGQSTPSTRPPVRGEFLVPRAPGAPAARDFLIEAPPTDATAIPRKAARFRPRVQLRDIENPPASAPPGSDASARLAVEVRRLLVENLGAESVFWVALLEDSGEGGDRGPRPVSGGFGPGGGGLRVLRATVKGPEGRTFIASTYVIEPSFSIPNDAWISIAFIFLVTAAFAVWAARLALVPVRMLGKAAERLSRNIDEPPLPVQGATEMREAASAFNRMQDRLRRHVKGRALAFAAMSHDMRTPLTRLRLRLESVADEAQREKLSRDITEIEALASSALEVTRGLAQNEEPAIVDLAKLVDDIVLDYAALGNEFKLRGRCAPIEMRRGAFKRAFLNLLDNAVKYGREVEIELVDSPNSLDLFVRDRGPGIPETEMENVFYPYYRVESSRNRDTGGAGLGLAIAKDVVESHGGELTLANRTGGGLEARIRLPRK